MKGTMGTHTVLKNKEAYRQDKQPLVLFFSRMIASGNDARDKNNSYVFCKSYVNRNGWKRKWIGMKGRKAALHNNTLEHRYSKDFHHEKRLPLSISLPRFCFEECSTASRFVRTLLPVTEQHYDLRRIEILRYIIINEIHLIMCIFIKKLRIDGSHLRISISFYEFEPVARR